ncbi:hypothetical protein ACFLTI_01870 [Bacteroidota bacterium]
MKKKIKTIIVKKLEKIIANNKKEFDFFEPDRNHIKRFSAMLDYSEKPLNIRIFKIMKFAAVILIILSIGFTGKIYLANKNPALSGGISLGEVSTEMAEVEAYYLFNIEMNTNILNGKLNSQPFSVKKDVYNTVRDMDKDYKSLKKELKQFSGNSRIIAAMLEYYMVKNRFLDDVIKKISE